MHSVLPDWTGASCAGVGSEPFFDTRKHDARRLCRACPLQALCLSYAMAVDVQGIWGGTTYSERCRTRRAAGLVPEQVGGDLYIGWMRTVGGDDEYTKGHDLRVRDSAAA